MEPELLKFRELIDEITRLKAVAEIKAKRAESDALQFKHLMDLAMETFNADKTKIQNLERLLDNTMQDGDYLKSQFVGCPAFLQNQDHTKEILGHSDCQEFLFLAQE